MKGSLLLVDDEPGILESLGEFFLGEGYHVSLAAGEEEALELYRAQRPAVVVSDLNLAPGSGIKLFARMREYEEEFPSPFCILMTGFGTMDNAVEALRGGADEYLQKPLQLAELRRVVDAGFARQQENLEKLGAQGAGMARRLGFDMCGPLRRMHADLELLELGRLGFLTQGQGLKVRALQSSLEQVLRSIDSLQKRNDELDFGVFLENVEIDQLLRQVQADYLIEFERKGVSFVQNLPFVSPLVWADAHYARALFEFILSSCLSMAHPGTTICLGWGQVGPDPTLDITISDGWGSLPVSIVWPTQSEIAMFVKANMSVQMEELGRKMIIQFKLNGAIF